MIIRFCTWLLQSKLTAEYIRGWEAGVDQQRYEPKSCDHHQTSLKDYWGEGE